MRLLDRRDFLTLAASAAALNLVELGGVACAAGNGQSDKKLIVIFLRGAIDGLSVVVPYRERNYYEARPTIALQTGANGIIDLDGKFGANPAFRPMMPLWAQGSLAFVHASGSIDPTRSHFDAQRIMEDGNTNPNSDGWLNRLLDVIPGSRVPPRGITFDATFPRIMSGPIEVTAMDALGNPAQSLLFENPMVAAAFDRMYNGQNELGRVYRDSKIAQREFAAVVGADPMSKEQAMADHGAPLPNRAAVLTRRLGVLLREQRHLQVAFLSFGGWDTHVGQGNIGGLLWHNLSFLAQGISGLVNALGERYRDTVIIVMSEFGRTVRENGDRGSDHGHGNVMWVLGGPVRGGKIYGLWPGLSPERLYQGRDLAITTDYRSILATVLSNHLKLSVSALQRVLPGVPMPDINLQRLIRA